MVVQLHDKEKMKLQYTCRNGNQKARHASGMRLSQHSYYHPLQLRLHIVPEKHRKHHLCEYIVVTYFDVTPPFRAALAGLKPGATKPKYVSTVQIQYCDIYRMRERSGPLHPCNNDCGAIIRLLPVSCPLRSLPAPFAANPVQLGA